MKTNVFVQRRGYDWWVSWEREQDGKKHRHSLPLGECSSEYDAVQLGALRAEVPEEEVQVREAL